MLYGVKISLRERNDLLKCSTFCGLVSAGLILDKRINFSEHLFVRPVDLEYVIHNLSKDAQSRAVSDFVSGLLIILSESARQVTKGGA